MAESGITVRRVHDPEDPALGVLSRLLQGTFADPDTVLELERIQAFLAEPSPDRDFCVVVAEDIGQVVGGTIFSYIPSSNCGFSEYLVVRRARHLQGIGRLLFDARRAVLDALAGQPCSGLFIEVDNPVRTPPELQARERETAMDALLRLQLFGHLGFLQVDLDYVQPPLGPGKQPVSYLDLLFAPWGANRSHVPAAWVTRTLCPIWTSWAPALGAQACETLRQHLGEAPVALVPLAEP